MTGLWDYSIMCLKLDVLYIGLCRDHEKPKFLWQKGELFWVSVTTWSFFLIALVAGELIMPPCLGPYTDMYIIKLVDIIKSLRTLLFWWVLKFHLKCCFRSRCFLYLKYSKFSNLHPSQITLNYIIIDKSDGTRSHDLRFLNVDFSVQFRHSVVSESLRPHESQHTRPPVYHQLLEFTQTHAHQVGDAIQPSHPLSPPSPPAPNPSQHQGLFQWVTSSHEVAKVLEFQL